MPIDIDAIRQRDRTPLLGQSTARALDLAILDRRDLLAEVDRLSAGIKAIADGLSLAAADTDAPMTDAHRGGLENISDQLMDLLTAGGAL